MKYIILLFVICAFAGKAPAQNRYGIFSYLVPDGFKLINTTDSIVVYSHADDGRNIFHLLVISKETASSGDAKSDFNKRWKIATGLLGLGISPKIKNIFTAGCYTVKEGSNEGMYQGLKCTFKLVSGAFVSNCNQPDKDPQYAPGRGMYSISNFTILLKYHDGHVVQKAFTGVADKNPATQNEVIYIGTNPFYLR